MRSTAAREVLHGTLPFAADLIDETLATIPPVAWSDNEIEMWDTQEIKLALAAG